MNRGLVFWGLALVVAGAVALLVQSGGLDEAAARGAWRFWPVALIAAGVAVITARTPFALIATVVAAVVVGGLAGTLVAGWPEGIGIGCGGEPAERLTDQGGFDGDAAAVELHFNCGDLAVALTEGSEWSVAARHGPDARPRIASDATSLNVTADDGGPIGFASTRQSWDVELPSDIELDLAVEANAASARLEVSGGQFSRLHLDANAGDVDVDVSGAEIAAFELEMNAGSASVTIDEETRVVGSVGMNAGSLEICAAEGSVVEVTLEDPNVTFSHDLGEHGFEESGDTWRLGSGTPDARFDVEGNAASLSFNPDGGCE